MVVPKLRRESQREVVQASPRAEFEFNDGAAGRMTKNFSAALTCGLPFRASVDFSCDFRGTDEVTLSHNPAVICLPDHDPWTVIRPVGVRLIFLDLGPLPVTSDQLLSSNLTTTWLNVRIHPFFRSVFSQILSSAPRTRLSCLTTKLIKKLFIAGILQYRFPRIRML